MTTQIPEGLCIKWGPRKSPITFQIIAAEAATTKREPTRMQNPSGLARLADGSVRLSRDQNTCQVSELLTVPGTHSVLVLNRVSSSTDQLSNAN